jgi:hypothetical protein
MGRPKNDKVQVNIRLNRDIVESLEGLNKSEWFESVAREILELGSPDERMGEEWRRSVERRLRRVWADLYEPEGANE